MVPPGWRGSLPHRMAGLWGPSSPGLRGKSTGHLNEARSALDISEQAEPSEFVDFSLPLPAGPSVAPGRVACLCWPTSGDLALHALRVTPSVLAQPRLGKFFLKSVSL